MFGKLKLELPFVKKVSLPEDDAFGGKDEEVVEAADALLTPMSDGEDKRVAEAAGALPVPVSGEEDEAVDVAADALLKPMEGEGSGDVTETEDVVTRLVKPEELLVGEDIDIEKEMETGGGVFDDIFDHEEEKEQSPTDLLIASLPDVTVQELFSAVEEVKALMRAWQLDEQNETAKTVEPSQ